MDSHQISLLLITDQGGLQDELQTAVAGMNQSSVRIWHASGFIQGIERARQHRPQIILVELQPGLTGLATFSAEISRNHPESVLLGIYTRDLLDSDESQELLIRAARLQVRDYLRRPLSTAELEEVFKRLGNVRAATTRRDGIVASMVSNKGGVGKSFLAVNLACALGQRYPDSVLLIDASLQLGVCSAYLGMNPNRSLMDAIRESGRLDETLLRQISVAHPSGIRLLAAPMQATDAVAVTEEDMTRIISLARSAFDFVVIDTVPVLDAVQMAILDLSDQVFVVTSPAVPTVRGAASMLELFGPLGIPAARTHVVLNHPQPRHSGGLRKNDLAARLDRPVDFSVNFSRKLLASTDLGEPAITNGRGLLGFRRSIKRMVATVESARNRTSARGTEPSTEAEASAHE